MGEVRSELEGGVLTITLADVENRNALGAPVVNGIHDGIERANGDDAIRAVVLTNDGNTFCAGANLKQQSGAEKGERPKVGLDGLFKMIQQSSTPVLGKIRGHVVGGGNGLAACLDIAIAKDDVKFGFTEVRLGVAPAIISVVCLPKMRRGEAMEAFLRGNRFSAAKAAEYGLISRAVPEAELDAAIGEVLADLRLGGPIALGEAKRLVYEVPDMAQDDAFAHTSALSARLFKGDEAAGGMRAFLKREKPPWAPEGD